MTNDEKGNIIARRVWQWLLREEAIDLVPWVANPKSPEHNPIAAAEIKGHKQCLQELRAFIEYTCGELNCGPPATNPLK